MDDARVVILAMAKAVDLVRHVTTDLVFRE